MTVIRLATYSVMASSTSTNPNSGTLYRYPHSKERTVDTSLPTLAPALLVSYVFLEAWEQNRHKYAYRDWVLDSGAFSARSQGLDIDLQAYIETCLRLLDGPDPPAEIYALDVIGDFRKGLRNTEAMWKAGIEAIPCYHYADNDWDGLLEIVRCYPKIAIGGMADLRGHVKRKFCEQSFARAWPKKIHGFGCSARDLVLAFPWHSVDATNWEQGPCRFGNWQTFGNMSVRGSRQNLRAEVQHYLDLEKLAQHRWQKQLAAL